MNMKASFDELPPTTIVDEKGNSNLMQFYSQSKFNFSDKVILNAGLHAQYFSLNGKYSIEPRANIKWKLAKKHSLSLGYGLHSQTEDLNVYLYQPQNQDVVETPNKKLDFAKSHHIVLGYDWFLSKNMRVRVEPYFQYLYDVPVEQGTTFAMLNIQSLWDFNKILVNEGEGRNLGVDLTVERFLNNGFYFLFTTSIFDSKYSDANGDWHNTRFNKNYVINALAGKEFVFDKANKNRVLGINTKISYAGGHRMYPIDKDLSMQIKDIAYDYSQPFTVQQEPDLFVDLTFTWRNNRPRFSTEWSIMVKNVFANPTDFGSYYDLKLNEIVSDKTVIVIPSISYKIEF